jgi:hypothetical protein
MDCDNMLSCRLLSLFWANVLPSPSVLKMEGLVGYHIQDGTLSQLRIPYSDSSINTDDLESLVQIFLLKELSINNVKHSWRICCCVCYM